MSERLKRVVFAIIFIPLIYLYVTRLPSGYFFGLMAVITLTGLYEFYNMFKLNTVLIITGILSALLLLTAFYIFPDSNISIEFLAIFSIIVSSIRLFLKKDPQGSLRDVAITLTGLVYVVLLMSYQLKLREIDSHWIIFMYGTIWLSDSMAYYTGTYLGKRRLYPEVSPKKTIEGAIASVIGGTGGGLILGILFNLSHTPTQYSIIGGIIGSLCIIGDLIESMFKRDAGVKDSSSLIPGHGGILDKIDSALITGPFLYWILISIQKIP